MGMIAAFTPWNQKSAGLYDQLVSLETKWSGKTTFLSYCQQCSNLDVAFEPVDACTNVERSNLLVTFPCITFVIFHISPTTFNSSIISRSFTRIPPSGSYLFTHTWTLPCLSCRPGHPIRAFASLSDLMRSHNKNDRKNYIWSRHCAKKLFL